MIYPRLGLFESIAEPGEPCFIVQEDDDDGQAVEVKHQHVLLPAHATGQHTVPPGTCANVPAVVKPPLPEALQHYKYSTLCFHSESIQKDVPLDKIGVYYQYHNLSHDLKVTLRYCNHFKASITIYDQEIIAHAQELIKCSQDEVDRSDDQIAY